MIKRLFGKLFPGTYLKLFYKTKVRKTLSLSFDCDYKKDTNAIPELLDTLESFKIKTNFACVGMHIKNNPKIYKKIIEYGHQITNHTHTHPNNRELNPIKFCDLTSDEKLNEIKKCHEICEKILNYSPCGFRTPHFLAHHNKDVYNALEHLNYKYSSSTLATRTKNHGIPYKVGKITEIPTTPCPNHVFTTFDSHHFRKGSHSYDKMPELFSKIMNTVDYINLYFDPMDIRKQKYFEEILETIKKSKIQIKTYEDVIKGI